MRKVCLSYITCPDLSTARRLSRELLKKRLAACTNLIPTMESHYLWKGKLNRSLEVILIAKTFASRRKQLEAFVVREHPYECPCILFLNVDTAHAPFVAWMSDLVPGTFQDRVKK